MRTERASALMLATLAASLLAMTAGLLMVETRAARATAGEARRLLQAQLDADALLARTIVRLDRGEPFPWRGVIVDEGEHGRVMRQDAAGLLDINAAPAETIAALFAGLGVETERAVMLAERTADWRDEDELRRLNGAERADYEAAGAEPPANRPFETEGELLHVLGMTRTIFDCARPYLTTYSGQAELDAAAAPDELFELLHQVSAERPAASVPMGRVIALMADAPLSDGAVLRRTLWIRMSADPERPVMVHRAAQELIPRGEPASLCQGLSHE
jgi:hypothetical protein